MSLLSRLSSLWRNLFRREEREQELTEEIDAYLQLLIEQKIDDGLDPAEARRAALIELGGKEQVKEKIRDVGMGHFLETLWRDVAYALRMLRRNPGFTAVAVLSLALGIGANTAIFSLMDAVLLKNLPVKNPERLFILEREPPTVGLKGSFRDLPYAFFAQLHERREVLANVCAILGSRGINVVVDGQAEVADVEMVSGSFYKVLGVNALLGRTITEDDDKIPGAHPVAVISYNYWQRRFGGDSPIVGKSITVNGYPFTIIGVTPPDFFGALVGEMPDLWAPTMMYAQIDPGRSIEEGYFKDGSVKTLLVRLKPGITEQQASAALTLRLQELLIAARNQSNTQESPSEQQSPRRQTVMLTPASRGMSMLRSQFSRPLRILMAAVGLVLLIACANVANLLLARATARSKEIAVRLALGAGRLRLIRQLLTESMLLALMGGALGLLFAWWGSGLLLTLVESGRDHFFLKLTLDLRVLGFTAGAALLSGILFGLVPACRATRIDLTPALKDSARGSRSGSRPGLGQTLVIAQVALSLLLLIGAGLFMRTLVNLKSQDAGFRRENVLLFSTDPNKNGYRGKRLADFYQRMLERIRTIPGVVSASLSGQTLLSGGVGRGNVTVDDPAAEDSLMRAADEWTPNITVGPEYFRTLGMTILHGRDFTSQDNENAPMVTVVNETFVRRYFIGDEPVGHRIRFGPNRGVGPVIIGVVNDAKYINLREQALPTYYRCYLQGGMSGMMYQIRTADDPTRIIAAVRHAAHEIDANLPIYDIKTLAKQVDESLVQERLIGTVSSYFGLLSLLLAAVGLYGVMAYAVNRRTHEIGIRMALGARRGDVLRMVLSQGMKLVLIGVVLGLAASFAATRLVASYLYGVTATDPVTFVGVAILLLIVALVACYVPARRATRVDPLVALREE